VVTVIVMVMLLLCCVAQLLLFYCLNTVWLFCILFYIHIINCNIVTYPYFPPVLSLHILHIQLQTVKYIDCIINCNIVTYPYFPPVLSLHILYIQLQTVKYIGCIINCNIVPYSFSFSKNRNLFSKHKISTLNSKAQY
jgi:hypothetical protein